MTDLSSSEWNTVDQFFESEVFPVLTPLAVDPGHPFPYVSNLSLSLAVEIRDPDRGLDHFARVKVPKSLPRWVSFGRGNAFVPLEEVIGANLGSLFPGMQVLGWWAFKVTRYSDLELDKTVDEPEDLLAMIEEQVFQRRFGEVVRLEVQHDMPRHIRALILEELQEAELLPGLVLAERDMFEGGPLLELGDLMSIAMLDIPELHDPPFVPTVPPAVRDATRSIFDVIRERDLLVHHPYESFTATVEQFLDAASRDDHVLAIKLTLYRTSGDTAIVRALTEAAQRGKQVAVLVELQARFDEANNITWARTLENFGVHVAYGLPGLKTHAKVALVVRREADGIRRYVHIGTGNYNTKTARTYTDLGLFTASPSIGADLSDLFNSLTGFSRQRVYRKLLVAPGNMRDRFLELISNETNAARAGKSAQIIAKMNALVDPGLIAALYEASQAGVDIDLIVRGICCLRPGVPGVSERIRVISIVGRFLEHSRLFYFREQRRRPLLHGFGRLDAAESGPTCRGRDARRGSRPASPAPGAARHLSRGQPPGVGALSGRQLRAAHARRRTGAGHAPAVAARSVGVRGRGSVTTARAGRRPAGRAARGAHRLTQHPVSSVPGHDRCYRSGFAPRCRTPHGDGCRRDFRSTSPAARRRCPIGRSRYRRGPRSRLESARPLTTTRTFGSRPTGRGVATALGDWRRS